MSRANSCFSTIERTVCLIPMYIKFCVISIGVLFYWRGTWLLLDLYLFPDQPDWSAWASLVIGWVGISVHNLSLKLQQGDNNETNKNVNDVSLKYEIDLESNSIDRIAEGTPTVMDDMSAAKKVQSITYAFIIGFCTNSFKTYYFAFLVVNAWRGIWNCQDLYIVFESIPALSPWLSHLIGVTVLITVGYFQSVLGAPYCFDLDDKVDIYSRNYSVLSYSE
jgi:hypothetical protein